MEYERTNNSTEGKDVEVDGPIRSLPGGHTTPKPHQQIRALNSPIRRRILRILHEAGEARSSKELAAEMGLVLGHVNYHVQALKKIGAIVLTDTRRVRGTVESFYASTVSDVPKVNGYLGETAREDLEGAT